MMENYRLSLRSRIGGTVIWKKKISIEENQRKRKPEKIIHLTIYKENDNDADYKVLKDLLLN